MVNKERKQLTLRLAGEPPWQQMVNENCPKRSDQSHPCNRGIPVEYLYSRELIIPLAQDGGVVQMPTDGESHEVGIT